jgi:ribosomal protein L31
MIHIYTLSNIDPEFRFIEAKLEEFNSIEELEHLLKKHSTIEIDSSIGKHMLYAGDHIFLEKKKAIEYFKTRMRAVIEVYNSYIEFHNQKIQSHETHIKDLQTKIDSL